MQPINAQQQAVLKDWQKTAFDWFQDDLYGHIYQNRLSQAQVLVLDGFVQMQILKGKPLGDPHTLDAYCASPLRTRTLAQGQILSCQSWAVWVRDDAIQEVWQMAE